MKKHIRWQRIISAFLCFVLLMSAMPISVFAQELNADNQSSQLNVQNTNDPQTVPNGEDSIDSLIDGTPVDYPQNVKDVLDVRQPQTVGVSTERPASFANNTTSLTYESGFNGTAATGFNSGSGTAGDPYIIKTGAQLKYFANQVNAGNSFSGKYIKLDANINLNGKDWTPIGYSQSKPFSGSFDGNYHEIKNMNVTYKSGNALDSETYYVGFWGYVYNANIKNLGVAEYTVNQTYSYHTVIGGFAAYVDGTNATPISNCYANGNITTNYGGLYYVGMEKTLQGKSDVYRITSVSNIPDNTNSITNANVLIDLSSIDSCAIDKTLTIGENVTTVQFIGKSDATYSNFNIVIAAGASDVNLIFENFNLIGNSSSGALYSDADRQINIYTCGSSNSIKNSISAPALNMSNASTTIMGEAEITFQVTGVAAQGYCPPKAGNGKHGDDGGTGSAGSTAVISDSVLIYTTNKVKCIGGQGGQGGKGGQGNSAWNKSKRNGGDGGNGGTGGAGLSVNHLGIIRGSVELTGGKGGTGGTGGGPGAYGTAGTGGTGGTGGVGLSIADSVVYGDISQLTPSGGAGGDAGDRGVKGGVDTGHNGSYGSPGSGGASSSKTYTATAISAYTWSPIIVEAKLTIGGFVGGVNGKASVSNSISLISSIIVPNNYPDEIYDSKWFAAENKASISEVLSLKPNGKGYSKHTLADSITGTGTATFSNTKLLTSLTDDEQGVVYSSGINSSGQYGNNISTTVVGKTGSKCDITIPESVYAGRFIMPVTGIDNGAFWNNTLVQNVTSGVNITTIGEAAFMGSSIVSFNDCDKVVSVGNRAFANCASLTKADISNAKDVGEVAFYGCTALSSVTIGDNLTEIKKGTFYNTAKLTTISVPKNIKTIGISAFYGSGLNSVDYSKATALTMISDSAFAYNTSLKSAVVPNTVKTIEACAYYGSTALTSISIGTSVLSVGEAVFYGCSSLETAIVPVNVKSIGASTFGGCSKLKNLTIPFVGATSEETDNTYFGYIFGAGSYKGNDDVVPSTLTSVTILGGATKIDEYAFCWCSNIKSVCLPETILSISKYAFCSSGLTEIVVPDGVESVGYAAFNCCSQIAKITIPFVGTSDNAEENNHFGYIFGAETFEFNNQYIPETIEVIISNNATIIADKAFYGCEDITAVSIGSSVKSIGDYAFFDCLNVVSIVVPDSVETIGIATFGKTSTETGKLKSIVLGNAVETIGTDILVGRDEIESITIGSSLVDIPELANAETPFGIDKSKSKLKEYIVSDSNIKFGAEDGILYELFTVLGQKLKVAIVDAPAKTKLSSTTFAPQKTDANGNVSADNDYYIVRIYPYAFAYNAQIKEVHLDYIRDIGTGAFSNCSELEIVAFGQYEESNETITILEVEYPKTNEHYSTFVGNSAFANCRKLYEINLESNALTKIGLNAFYNCATSESVEPLSLTLGENISVLSATDDELINNAQYTTAEMMLKSFMSAFDEAEVREFKVADGNTTFVAIDGVLFYRSGETVSDSDKEALWLAIYPRNAYASNYELTNDSENSYTITYISPWAFSGAENLLTLTIGDGVTQVGRYAFNDMTALHTLNIGNDVRTLGGDGMIASLFDGCGALQNIYVDVDNTYYSDVDGVLMDKDQYLFIKYPEAKQGSDYLVPDTVREVNAKAFLGNNLIRHITFSNEIVYVGSEAFHECPNLSFIYFKKGDCPFITATDMKTSNAFYTTNPRVLVCYGEEIDNSRWTKFSTDEANQNYYSEITTQGGTSVRLFQVAKYTAFPTDIQNTGYYAVVVLDKSGALLNDINVSIGTEQSIDTINGIAMFYNLDYSRPYELKVFDNLGVYFPTVNSEFYLDEATKITYITLSAVPTVSGIRVEYDVESADEIKEILAKEASATIIGDGHKVFDINSETAKINKWLTDQIVISVNCGLDLDGTIEDCYLLQNGNKIKCENISISDYQTLGAKKYATIDFTIQTVNLTNEQDVYVAVQTSTGLVQTKLNIHIFNMEFKGIDLSFLNDDWTFPVSSELTQILKGFGSELSFKPKGSKLRYSVKNEADSVKIAVSYGKNHDDAFDFDGIDAWTKYVNDIKKGQVDKFHPYKDEKVNEASLNLQGYIELKYKGLDENGDPDIEVKSGIIGTLKLTRGWGASYTIVVVPVRVEAELSLSGSLKLELVFDKEAEELISGSIDLTVKGALELSAGVGCKIASAGIYGSAETIIVLNIVPSFELESWKISGDIGFYVQYRGLFVKWKKTWSLLKGMGIDADWVLYKNGKWWYEADGQVASISDVSVASAIYDEDAYEIAASSFDPEVMTFSLTGIQDAQKSDYAGIEPKMLQIGDIIYIVYQEDLNGYSDKYDEYNYQKIVYQTYNAVTGEFSEVYVLDDNGYADGEYEVYYDGTNAVIVYSQLKKILTTDNIDDMAGYVGSLEVKTAVLKDGCFVASNDALTSNEYYDMNLRIGEVNGKITAVWVQNAENTMFGTTDNNNMAIWYSIYDGEAWGSPVCLKSNINTITDIEIGNAGVVYITDINNDLTTIGAEKTTEGYSDRIITVVDMTGNVVLVTAEESAYHDVSYFANEIVYYSGSNLYSIDTNSAFFAEAIKGLTEEYTILTDVAGNVKAILFVNTVVYDEETGADGSNIFAIFCNENAWGAPVQITDFGVGYYVSAYDAIDFDDEILISVLLSEIEYSEESLDEYDNYVTTNRFETLWFDYPTNYVVGDVLFDYESIKTNANVSISIPITNNGYQSLHYNDIPVAIDGFECTKIGFFDKDGNAFSNGLLASGNTGYLKVDFVTNNAEDKSYHVNINGETREFRLWYSDFSLTGKQVLIGDTYHIVLLVENNGYLNGRYNISANCNGELIWNNNQEVIELGSGESKYFIIPLETTFAEASRLIEIVVDAENEYLTTNNKTVINVTTEEDLSEQVQLSIKTITIDRSTVNNQYFEVSFEDKYTFQNVLINGLEYIGEYTISSNKITFDKASMASVFSENGIYTLTFVFLGDSGAEKTSTFVVNMTEFFTITWIIDGKTTYEEYEVGAQLVPITPSKDADAYYTYTFDGWDKQLQMTVNEDATYTGMFSKHRIQYEITWVVDGNEETTFVNSLDIPMYDTPTKTSDAEWDYTFVGWSPVVEEATKDCVYTAEFTKTPRKYTVTWIVNGVESNEEYTYNQVPVKENPQSFSDNEYFYTFKSWDKNVVAVTENVIYTALWNSEPVYYTVTWDVDGVKTYSNYRYNQLPDYGSVPVKSSNEQYDYTFIGWSTDIAPVTSNIEYVAKFDAVLRKYTVKWIVDGIAEEQELYYGELPTHYNPTKASDQQYDYVFVGWSKEPSVVYGDQEYIANFTPVLRKYTITWIVDGSEYSSLVYCNSIPSFMGVPSKVGDAQYSYKFIGWTPELEAVAEDKTYTAVFEKTVNSYTVTWIVGNETYSDIYKYGEMPMFDGNLYSGEQNENTCYVFKNWDKALNEVSQDVTYTAIFENESGHDFSSKTETNDHGIEYTVFSCDCGYSYSVMPESVPSLTVSSGSSVAGSVVTVEILVNNNPGVLGAVLTVKYDEDLKLVSAESGEAWSTLNLTLPGTYNNACSFVWDGVSDVDTANGSILKLNFEIASDASVGDKFGVSVEYKTGSVVGENSTPIAFMTYDGVVTVDDYSYGDVNGDNIIDVSDVIVLRQYLAGGYGVDILLDAADVNGDGVVDVSDVILIRQYLAGGYNVVLGKNNS